MSTSSAVWVLVFQKQNFLSISLDILSSTDGGGSGNEGKRAVRRWCVTRRVTFLPLSHNTPTDHESLLHASVDPNSSGWEWKMSKLDEGHVL